MHQIIKFADMKAGSKYRTLALVLKMTEAVTKNGKPYVKLILTDGDRNIMASYFNVTVEELESLGVEKNVTVELSLLVRDKYINVSEIKRGQEQDFSLLYLRQDMMDASENLFNQMLDTIRRHAQPGGEYNSLSDLTAFILGCFKNKLIGSYVDRSEANKELEDLFLHTVRMVDAAEKLGCAYPLELDMELLICGAALHDIGKIKAYETNEQGATVCTAQGKLLGHSLLGMEIMDDFRYVIRCDSERLMLLKHLIASHHGTLADGAIVTPAIPEALALHALDMIDAGIGQYEEEDRKMEDATIANRIPEYTNLTLYLLSKSDCKKDITVVHEKIV